MLTIFVSLFIPIVGLYEDSVTSSAHCALIPFLSESIDKKQLKAYQTLSRGKKLFCEDLGVRIGEPAYLI
ncbi:phenazine biosynthesis-like domain protein [Leptospira mayottensis 200901122]|uniref:Phenazine biosynthesis-like domain protein n=1 Tax=Leptospira mayottensis 200901122 TaxID=1193010 RepID=A0AA87SYY3_9LEPT|nr:phenazine biosynthesis-like domain protein [Leptospira mayottensis 200901122]